MGLVYNPRRLPGVTTARPGVPVMLYQSHPHSFTGAYGPVEKDTVAYRPRMWVCLHDAWVLREGHSMVCMLLTRRTVHICQSWTYRRGQGGTFLAWG
jgi:hypothetical protein